MFTTVLMYIISGEKLPEYQEGARKGYADSSA